MSVRSSKTESFLRPMMYKPYRITIYQIDDVGIVAQMLKRWVRLIAVPPSCIGSKYEMSSVNSSGQPGASARILIWLDGTEPPRRQPPGCQSHTGYGCALPRITPYPKIKGQTACGRQITPARSNQFTSHLLWPNRPSQLCTLERGFRVSSANFSVCLRLQTSMCLCHSVD